jgi:hypothetical protein
LSNRARQTAQATSASITARLLRDLDEEFKQIDAERTGYDEQFALLPSQATVLDRGASLDNKGGRGGPTIGGLPKGVLGERARCLRGISIAELRPADGSAVGASSESVSFLGSCGATGG